MVWIRFKPVYQERVWGGRALAESLGRELPGGGPTGESWEVVDRPEAQSTIAAGPGAGGTLRALLASRADVVMGAGYPPERPFPILVKWLDCHRRLSLQVHPPAGVAAELGGEPKTENWFVAATAGDDPSVLVGLAEGADRGAFAAAIKAGGAGVETLVRRFRVAPGDSVFVPSGQVHAIDAGSLILEVQENSDTTYRVYDWGRTGLDGLPRQLHVEESLRSIDFGAEPPEPIRTGEGAPPADGAVRETPLAACPAFRLRHFSLGPGAGLELPAEGAPRLLHGIVGRLSDEVSGEVLAAGENVLVPAGAAALLRCAEPAAILVTDQFV